MIDTSLMDTFIEYATFDEVGDINGIAEDAPEEAKKAFEEFMQMQSDAKENGYKI